MSGLYLKAMYVSITPGTLISLITVSLATLTSLTLTDSINACDFKTMGDTLPLLTTIDLSCESYIDIGATDNTYISK